jgi:glycosyltransferase involved in cell wall biosynthesis
MVRVAMVVTNACAPDPRVLRHAVWMQQAGYQVTVHAFDRSENHPMSENYHGVRIMRYRIGKVAYGGTLSTYRGIRRFQRTVIRTLSHDPPHLVYCHDADTLRIGAELKSDGGVPFVFDMHDLQHTWVLYDAPQSRIRAMVSGRMKQRMLSRAAQAETIITSSQQVKKDSHRGFVEWLAHHGLESEAVENRPLPPFGHSKSPPADQWTVGYIGRVRDIKAFELLVQAVKTLPPLHRPKIRVAGDGTAAARVRTMLLDEVEAGTLEAEVSGAFTQAELPELLGEIDVMYAMYSPRRGNILQGALPVKMFDAAAHGVPSLVNDGCLMGDVAKKEGAGLTAPWGDAEAIGRTLFELKEQVAVLEATGEREHQRWLTAMQTVLAGLQ